MRIMLLCPTWGGFGGIERKAESLVAAFRAAGHDVAILARGPRHASEPGAVVPVFRLPLRLLPTRTHRLKRGFRLALHLPGLLAAGRRVLRGWDADVVLSLAVSSYAPYTIGLSRTRPLVFSIETAGPDLEQHPRAIRRAFETAARVVGCASSLAARARAMTPAAAARIAYIPNGVDVDRFAARPLPAPHPRPYVLSVGRLTHQKALDVLLDAWALALPSLAGIDLLLAGEGPDRSALAAQAQRLGIADRVHLLGPAGGDALVALYRHALFLACPSRWEGLPLVVLEAMASGIPVLGSTVDGIPDAVRAGETGLLVPPEDVTALADGLRALALDPGALRRMGVRGRAVAEAEFGWPHVARTYLELLAAAVADQTRS
jgi:glycosyltransferase involved in cell wall biosynthesis